MAKDPFGNYQVAWATPPASISSLFGIVLNGTGVPASTLGNNGNLYVDLATGNLYQKTNGAWAIVSGGGGGGTIQVVAGAFANPNGNVTPADTTKAAVYYQDQVQTNLWLWSVVGQNWNVAIGA